eukprot:gene52187-69820_t
MGVLQNGLNLLAVPSFYQQMAIGAVLVLAVWIEKFSALRQKLQRDGRWLRELARLESSPRLGEQPWLMLALLVLLPVAVVGETFKQNGLTNAADIHAVDIKKLDEIFGADAALYVTISNYGATYTVLNSVVVVSVDAKLVDVKT